MRIPGSPRSSTGAVPAWPPGRGTPDGAPHTRRWRAGLKRSAVLLLLIVAGISTSRQWTEAVADERNVEQYAIKRAQPTYPPLAQKQRIEGIVVVQVTVNGGGKVTNAEFVRGNNIFKAVSLEAARRWEFKVPSGEGLEGTIRFTFKLD